MKPGDSFIKEIAGNVYMYVFVGTTRDRGINKAFCEWYKSRSAIDSSVSRPVFIELVNGKARPCYSISIMEIQRGASDVIPWDDA